MTTHYALDQALGSARSSRAPYSSAFVIRKNIPNLSGYAGLRKVAEVDTGESIHALMKFSHIHLFGIGLAALGIGMIFRHAAPRP